MNLKKTFTEWARGLSAHNEKGEEIPDPTPIEIPVDWQRPLPLAEEVRRLVHNERIQAELSAAGAETFEDADDFKLEDEEELQSPWEDNFDTGRVWNRDAEIRAGIVSEPDYQKAKELVTKAQALINQWETANKAAGSPPKAASQA